MVERPPDTPDPGEDLPGFEDSEGEDAIRREAEADDGLAPGSMPPEDETAA
jgi:hypothetical protein